MLRHLAISKDVREEAQLLLDEGADPDYLRDLRISCTSALAGDEAAMYWGASVTPLVCVQAKRRVREAGLVDGALYLAVLYVAAKTAPPPIYLGSGSGLGGGPGDGLAWSPGSGVDPSIRVRRYPDPVQGDLWDSDDVPWSELARLRAAYQDLT
jgi:hypothetical protein